MKSMKLAFMGECMIELQETATKLTTQTFGGDTLNSAIYCARVTRDFPVQVDYVTALGTDTFSDRMIAFWEKEGVGSSLVQRVKGERPGLYYIEVDEYGERIFHYWRGEAAVKKCFEYPGSQDVLEKLSDYDGIYLSGISLAIFTSKSRRILIKRLEELKREGLTIYFDCNYRPHLWKDPLLAKSIYEQIFPLTDIIFLTAEEADILLGVSVVEQIQDRLKEKGVGESVIKDGGGVCSVFSENKRFEIPASPVTRVVDTTAAGDSFSGVYLLARSFGCPPEKAAILAHRMAAYVISHKGAIAPLENMVVKGSDIIDCKQ